MRFFCTVFLLSALAGSLAGQTALIDAQQKFTSELATVVQDLEKKKVAVAEGEAGWLFFSRELRFLSLGRFWGDEAAKVSRARKPELANPLPAIIDFQQQLKARGIELIMVPVPPKAAIYPEKIVPGFDLRSNDPALVLRQFYEELRAAGIEVLNLAPMFIENREHARGPVFCRTDSHWSGIGCVLAAQAIAEHVRGKLPAPAVRKECTSDWKEVQITGDLTGFLPPDASKRDSEKIWTKTVSEKGTGAAVEPDSNSPLLLLGDSNTLVYHDFLAERAGLMDQLALELGFAPDLIGTRGSGATPARINLYRRSLKDPGYLAKKKVVIWCFAARDFTEATEGWAKVPVAK
jgi:alginate O-acetyltransferase complex protein AlgJ